MTATMPDRNRKWRLRSRPTGEPVPEDFELIETDVPEPGRDEVVVRTRFLSVDPYMRGRMRDADSYADPWAVGDVLRGRVVGEVVASDHRSHAPGDVVVGRLDWADYGVAPGHRLAPVDQDLAPISTALGVLGTPGRTAYFGTFDVAEPRPGDTAVVSGAAGAVGSVAGQLAGLAGCRVVGIAGTDEKVAWLTEGLGLDAGINYWTADVGAALDEACPDGVDVYFDNVGGPITDAVVDRLAVGARVAVCGQIALYNATDPPVGPRKLWTLIKRRARVEGFLVSDFDHRREEAANRLSGWVRDGDVSYRESIVDGLEHAPAAFIGLFAGDNIGKQLVRVGDAAC